MPAVIGVITAGEPVPDVTGAARQCKDYFLSGLPVNT